MVTLPGRSVHQLSLLQLITNNKNKNKTEMAFKTVTRVATRFFNTFHYATRASAGGVNTSPPPSQPPEFPASDSTSAPFQSPTKSNVKLQMRGWQVHNYGGIEELQFTDKLKMPQIRNANECLVRVMATTVNPIDLAMLNGYGSTILNAVRFQPDAIEFPLVLGREFCGEIVQCGMSISGWKLPLGERVWGVVPIHYTSGAHAEHLVVPDYCLAPAPTALSNEEAASVLYAGLTAWSGLYVTAGLGGIYGALTANGGGANHRVLVLGGSGSVGSLAIQMLKAQGAQVVTTCSEDARELVKNLGADVVVNYESPHEVEALRSYGPFDVVLDCAGQGAKGASSLNTPFHQYVTFSSPLLRNIDNCGLGLGLLKNVADIVEVNVKSLSSQRALVKWGFFTPAPQGIELLKQLVERGKLLPLVDSCYKFEQLPEAFQRVKRGHLRGKVVVNLE